MQQDLWRSHGGTRRAKNIRVDVHAQWQRDVEELWNDEKLWQKGRRSLNKIAAKLAKKYRKEYQDAAPDDKAEKEKYARSYHTIRKYIHAPE